MEIGAIIVILVALAFDFTNGFHDAANSIATVVSTRVLSPRYAVIWAAFFNFVAFLIFSTHVANTIAKDVVVQERPHRRGDLRRPPRCDRLEPVDVLARPPHQLVARPRRWHGRCGGGAGRFRCPDIRRAWRPSAPSSCLSPLIGLAIGLLLTVIIQWVFHREKNLPRLNKGFRRGQLVSAAAFSLGHGGNDAQKTMGIILAVLIAVGSLPADAEVPLWVVLSAHTAIALGTLFGGWRIVKTMGFKLTKLQPSGGVAAESAAAATLFFASAQGIPVSTTHTITGAIVGVGASRRMSAVRWRVAGRVLWAWIFTIPGAAIVAGIFSLIVEALA